MIYNKSKAGWLRFCPQTGHKYQLGSPKADLPGCHHHKRGMASHRPGTGLELPLCTGL